MVRRIEDERQNDLGWPAMPRVFHPPANWTPCVELPELEGLVAIDLETKDPGISRKTGPSWPLAGEGFVCGIAICWAKSKFYIPLRHAVGNVVDQDKVWVWLRAQAGKSSVTFVMANAAYDTGWLRRHYVRLANPPVDVQVMAFLLDEHRRSYSLASLATDYLRRSKGTASLVDTAKTLKIFDPMSNMDCMPAWVVEPYALDDVDLTYCLYYHLMPQITGQNLGVALKLESDCTMVAVDMRLHGVRVDQAKLERLGVTFAGHRDLALAIVRDKTGVALQPFDNGTAMKALLAENGAVLFGKTEKNKDSVDRFTLERIGSPVAKAILAARKYEKARNTFVESLSKYIVRGRVHAEFHSTRNSSSNEAAEFGDASVYGAGSGRWASSNPNLQNIPARDPQIGPLIRSCFVPEEGERWVKLDYASQEPRLTVHIAHLANMAGAAEMVERFRRDPMTDLHGECASLMGVPRGQAKTINLALTYGQQGAAMCEQLGLPVKSVRLRSGELFMVAGDEGQRLLDRHAAAVPFISGVFEMAKHTARQRGYVKTLIGRRIRFERHQGGRYKRLHKALNGVVQGNAADQMKQACVALRLAGLLPDVIVHDEADRSVPMGAEGDRMIAEMKSIMENVVQYSLPFVVESSTGPSWGEVG